MGFLRPNGIKKATGRAEGFPDLFPRHDTPHELAATITIRRNGTAEITCPIPGATAYFTMKKNGQKFCGSTPAGDISYEQWHPERFSLLKEALEKYGEKIYASFSPENQRLLHDRLAGVGIEVPLPKQVHPFE